MKISAVFGLSCAISVAALPELASKFVQNRRSLKRVRGTVIVEVSLTTLNDKMIHDVERSDPLSRRHALE
jgi:hypothetical protein